MEKDKSSICVLVKCLNRPFSFASKVYRAAVNDDRFILDNYKKTLVEEKLLIHLIKKSMLFPSLRLLIPDILYYTHESSITENVFRVCSKYPGHYRKTLLNLLAHMWLSHNLLYKLNLMIDTPEAFCKLIVLYLTNDFISTNYFVSFIEDNKKHLSNVDVDTVVKNIDFCGDSEVMVAKKKILETYK